MANIGNLNAKITADTKDFEKKLDGARRKSQSFGNKAAESFKKMNKAVSVAKAAVVGLVAALAVRGAFRALNSAIDRLDKLGDTANKIGFTTDALQELRHAGEQVNVTQQTTDLALQRFSRRLAEARKGTGELKGVLEQYGIALSDSNGRAKTNEQVLKDLADTIGNTTNEGEQLLIAFKAFDSEGAGFVNVLKGGSAELNRFAEEARAMGLVVDSSIIAKAGEAGDKLNLMSRVLQTQFTVALAEGSDAIVSIGTAFAAAVPSMLAFFETWFRNMDEWSTSTIRHEISELEKEIALLEQSSAGYAQGMMRSSEERLKELTTLLAQKEAEAAEAAERRQVAADAAAESYKRQSEELAKQAEAREAADKAEKEQEKENKKREEQLQKEVELLEQQAQKWKDIVDPTREYTRQLEEVHNLLALGKITAEEHAAAVAGIAEELVKLKIGDVAEETKELEKTAAEMGAVFTSAFEDAILKGGDFGDVLKGLTDDLIRMLLRVAVLDPLADSLSSAFESIIPGGKAGGGIIQPGRIALVGERGPELIMPNAPARVVNNQAMGGMMGGSSNVVVQIKNDGTPQRITNSTATQRGDKMIISVLTQDIETGGPFTRKLQSSFDGLRRTG